METEKLAKAMAESMGAKLVKADEIATEELVEYELIGFGSGIYAFNKNNDLIGFIETDGLHEQEIYILVR